MKQSRPFSCLAFVLVSLATSVWAAAPEVMRYRIATVNPNAWCDPAQKATVAAEVDRIVAAGFNGLSIGSYKFMPMLFVDYSQTKYPEAQEYSPEKIRRNVETLRQNIRAAKAKGIKLFVSRSYSHYAPYRFWKAHQPELNPGGVFTTLLERAHQSDIYEKTLAGKDNIIPQQQWTNPLFKRFFLDSTALMLDALPELDGFLNAYAEAAWTYDVAKLKAGTWTSWKDAVDYPATDAQFVDYANSLHRLLVEKRGDRMFFGLRDWYVKPEVLQRLDMPREQLVIAVKYAGFDQPLVNYPPWGKSLLDAGYSVILDLLVYDAESPHPIYWYDRDMVFEMFRHMHAGGFSGVTYQDFTVKGEDSPTNPIRLLTQRTVGAAMRGQDFSRSDAVEFLRPDYGDGAGDLVESLHEVALARAEMIKLCPAWFWQGDGLTPGGPQPLRFWMLMDNPDAPPGMAFARQDVVGVKEYALAERAGPEALARAVAAWRRERRKTPLEVIQVMEQSANLALTAAGNAARKAPSKAPFLRDIVASAVIHEELVRRDVAFLKAALAFYASGAVYDDKYTLDKTLQPSPFDRRGECVEQMRAVIAHDEVLRELCLQHAPRRRTTRAKNDYGFEKKIAAIAGAKLEIPPLDKTELAEMNALIDKLNSR
jgi:hypothetical protein